MTIKAERVFRGWMDLNDSEKREFEGAMREYEAADITKKRELRESYGRMVKMQTGPLGESCPCCGR